jgi:hypothetical protein
MTDDKPKTANDLVNEVLAKPPGAPVPESLGGSSELASAEATVLDVAAEELVELYFVLEEPGERDNVFDRLMDIQSPVVMQFLTSMMQNDEDEFMRVCAAAELARRGNDAGVNALEKELREPSDSQIFAMAVDVLIELRGAGVYDLLQAIWSNPSYDNDERVEAMLGMEDANPPRAMDDFVKYIESIRDMRTVSEDQLETVLAAFARSGHMAAKPALEALRERVLKGDMEEDERANIVGMIKEGLELIDVT